MTKRGEYKIADLISGYQYRVTEFSGAADNPKIKETVYQFREGSAEIALAHELYKLRLEIEKLKGVK